MKLMVISSDCGMLHNYQFFFKSSCHFHVVRYCAIINIMAFLELYVLSAIKCISVDTYAHSPLGCVYALQCMHYSTCGKAVLSLVISMQIPMTTLCFTMLCKTWREVHCTDSQYRHVVLLCFISFLLFCVYACVYVSGWKGSCRRDSHYLSLPMTYPSSLEVHTYVGTCPIWLLIVPINELCILVISLISLTNQLCGSCKSAVGKLCGCACKLIVIHASFTQYSSVLLSSPLDVCVHTCELGSGKH